MEIFWESFRKFREKIQIEWTLRVRNFRKFGITFYKIAENADYTSQIFFLTLLSQVSPILVESYIGVYLFSC